MGPIQPTPRTNALSPTPASPRSSHTRWSTSQQLVVGEERAREPRELHGALGQGMVGEHRGVEVAEQTLGDLERQQVRRERAVGRARHDARDEGGGHRVGALGREGEPVAHGRHLERQRRIRRRPEQPRAAQPGRLRGEDQPGRPAAGRLEAHREQLGERHRAGILLGVEPHQPAEPSLAGQAGGQHGAGRRGAVAPRHSPACGRRRSGSRTRTRPPRAARPGARGTRRSRRRSRRAPARTRCPEAATTRGRASARRRGRELSRMAVEPATERLVRVGGRHLVLAAGAEVGAELPGGELEAGRARANPAVGAGIPAQHRERFAHGRGERGDADVAPEHRELLLPARDDARGGRADVGHVGEIEVERPDAVPEQILEGVGEVLGPLPVEAAAQPEHRGPALAGGVDLHGDRGFSPGPAVRAALRTAGPT